MNELIQGKWGKFLLNKSLLENIEFFYLKGLFLKKSEDDKEKDQLLGALISFKRLKIEDNLLLAGFLFRQMIS